MAADRRTHMTWLYYLVAAAFGLIFGSFFNVVIYRLPRDRSLGHRSQCPSCGELIHWYDNIPVLSFLILRGRCRNCGLRISWQYPLVEITSGLLFALTYWWSIDVVPGMLKLGPVQGSKALQPELFIGLVLVSILIISTGVDITHGIIPNVVILAGLIMMLPMVVAFALYRGQPGRIGISILSAVAGAAFFLMAGLLYGYLFMRGKDTAELSPDEAEGNRSGVRASNRNGGEQPDVSEDEELPTGIGMGDMKLMLFTGLALGYFHWYFVIIQIFVAALIGTLAAIPLKVFTGKGRKDRIPFGPFLAAGAVVAILWGQALADVYVRLLR